MKIDALLAGSKPAKGPEHVQQGFFDDASA
jgi:hypothetical protein